MSEEALEVLKGATGGGSGEGFEGYGPKMDRIVESVTSLGRYYAGVSGRVSLSSGAKAGMPTLAKLAGSLVQTVQHMEVGLVSVLAAGPPRGRRVYPRRVLLPAGMFPRDQREDREPAEGCRYREKAKGAGGEGRVCRDPPPPVQKKSRRGKK
ncbi:unnamed protein product [Ectocarpus sp. 4 AP-2014]